MKVLIAFYENRLKDHYVVTSPVLQGLRALVSLYMLDFQYQGCPPQKNTELFLYGSEITGFVFSLLWWWPVIASCFSHVFPDKVHSVASWLSCVNAEGCVSRCSCSGEASCSYDVAFAFGCLNWLLIAVDCLCCTIINCASLRDATKYLDFRSYSPFVQICFSAGT